MRDRLVLERPCLPRTSMYSINRMTDGCGNTKCCERRTRSPSSSTTSAEPFQTSRTERGTLTIPSASYEAFNSKTFRVSAIETPWGRGSRIENRGLRIDASQVVNYLRSSILDPLFSILYSRPSILDPLFSILYPRSSILDPLFSILYPPSTKPAARFELASTAYETVALPI